MLKVFVPTPLPKVRQLPLLERTYPHERRLFQQIPFAEYSGIIESVPMQDARYLLVPHAMADLRTRRGYLNETLEMASRARMRPIIFNNQDDPMPVHIPGGIILRQSAYRSTRLPNEIITPALVEDVGRTEFEPRPKGMHPTVGFVGKAGFNSIKEMARYAIRNYAMRSGADREGIYFRRRALALLSRDFRIELRSSIRRSFSAHASTIELAPERARAEYLESLERNLFTLAPRGDGNYSLRFYETLSMGRLPILIDTDMELPLEREIPYDSFIVRVPWDELDRLGDIVWQMWQSHDEDELIEMQRKARNAFETSLYFPAFLRKMLVPERLAAIP